MTKNNQPAQNNQPARRAILGAGLLTTYAIAALDAKASPITTPDNGLITGMTHYNSSGFSLPAFVARPARRGRFPVVIVVSEIFGLHAYIADICRRLARHNIVAIAPDFFARAGDPSKLTDFPAILAIVSTANNAQVMGDIEATIQYLSAQSFVDRAHMGITGYCWGGAVTWMAMSRFETLKAGVAWYGRLRRPANGGEDRQYPMDLAGQLKGPVLGLYASDDGGIPISDVTAMNEALAAHDHHHSQIRVMPNTHHGFHADYRDSYSPSAAQEGWARMLSHFAHSGIGDGG